MCYGEKGTVQFLETLADNVFRHNYSMMQKNQRTMGNCWGYPGLRTPLSIAGCNHVEMTYQCNYFQRQHHINKMCQLQFQLEINHNSKTKLNFLDGLTKYSFYEDHINNV